MLYSKKNGTRFLLAFHVFLITGCLSNSYQSSTSSSTGSVDATAITLGSISLSPSLPDILGTSSFSSSILVKEGSSVTSKLSCRLDSNIETDCSNKILNLSQLANGSHQVTINGYNNDGKLTVTYKKTFSVQIPQNSIAISLSPAIPASLSTNAVTSTIVTTISGNTSVVSLLCQLDSLASYDCSNKSINLTNLSNGTHSLKITASDSLGLKTTQNFSFSVQVVAQSISLSLNPAIPATIASSSYSTSIKVTATGGLTLASATCQLDSLASYDCSNLSVSLTNLSNGNHTFKVSGIGSDGKTIPTITSSFVVQIATGTGGNGVINVDPTIKYQKMRGYEAHTYAVDTSPVFSQMINKVLDNAVNLEGVNRIRLEVRAGSENTVDYYAQYKNGTISSSMWRCLRYSTINDDSSPSTTNLNGFHFTEIDESIQNTVLPLIQKMKAIGKTLYINLNYVAFTQQLTGAGCPAGLQYHHNSPQEYAEFIGVLYDHLKSKWGLTPNALEIMLEPDLAAHWTDGVQVGQAIVATEAVLKSKGYPTNFIAPSTTNIAAASTWIDKMATVPGALNNVVEFSYHKYSSYPTTTLIAQQEIAKRVKLYNIPSAMLEYWVQANNYTMLHNEIKVALVSAYQLGVLCADPTGLAPFNYCDDSNPAAPTVTPSPVAKIMSQYYKYMDFGAQRIEAISQNTVFDPLAFINPNGKYLVIVKATAGGSFTIGKLPAGTYGISYSTSSAFQVSLPDQVVTAGGVISTSIPAAGAITIYQK